MQSRRKFIRIALSENDANEFTRRKKEAEKKIGLKLSDTMFAGGLIREALKKL